MNVILLGIFGIVAIVVGSLAALAILIVVLNLTILRAIRNKKAVRELNRRFEYLHALLFGQDAQYLKRIEIISKTNLLYVEIHMNFNKRFKEVRDKFDASAQTAVNNLKDLLGDKNYKALKIALTPAKSTIDLYDEQVNSFNNDLLVIVKPEEDCRQQSLTLKEELRRIKQDYYVKQADLTLVCSSFEKIFGLIDNRFKSFESLVEGANYDEARQMLPEIGKVIKNLGKALNDLPNICASVQTLVPDKIASLENRYDDMLHDGYPLFHLLNEDSIEAMKKALTAITIKVQAFDLKGITERLDNIVTACNDYNESFDAEIEFRKQFEERCDAAYASSSAVEKKYIKLCNALPNVKQFYVISESEQSKIDGIKNLINKAGATKRSLDTLIHSGTKQPYSLLVEKMKMLEDETSSASGAIDEFGVYLSSLKTDGQAAIDIIKNYYAKTKQDEMILHQIGIDSISDSHKEGIERIYSNIDAAYTVLNTKPINIEKVNVLATLIKEDGDKEHSSIDNQFKLMGKAESALIYGNRDRKKSSEVDMAIKSSENLFFAGEFDKSYNEMLATLKTYLSEQ